MSALTFPLVNPSPVIARGSHYQEIADRYGIPVARVRAVTHVEAAGRGFTSSGWLRLLYEAHIAYRASSGAIRSALVKAGLAWKGWKPGRYPKTQAARHDQVKRAEGIAGDVGFMASSYGLPQVLGLNHKMCGFATAEEMVAYMLTGEPAQLDVMFRFIVAAGLLKHLKGAKANYAAFARGYNGPAYKKNRYDAKLRAAEDMFQRGGTMSPRSGLGHAPNPDVKEAQQILTKLGYDAGPIDGLNGPKTQAAVLKFQETHPDLANDGRIGPHTLAMLRKAVEAQKAEDNAKAGQVGTVIVGTGVGGAAAATGMPWWVMALIIVAVIAVIGGISWWLWRNYRPEIEQAANITKNKIVHVKEWAERLADGDLTEGAKA